MSRVPGFSTKFFIAQVPLNQLDNKVSIGRWGDRVQIRIIGVDPASGSDMRDDDLRTATIIKPTSQGNFNRGSTAITGGEIVIGMFVSGPPEYDAVILGVLPKTDSRYELNAAEVAQKGSTEFKTVNPYYGPLEPMAFQVRGGAKSNNKTVPTVPGKSLWDSWFKKNAAQAN